MKFYNNLALTRLGSHVGKVIRYDHNTEETLCGRYARVCVEIDLTKPMVSKIYLGKQLQGVEYEFPSTELLHQHQN
ncbi:hypothetical protein REPUB_Repub04eG0162300 [Reevesia pubescens]